MFWMQLRTLFYYINYDIKTGHTYRMDTVFWWALATWLVEWEVIFDYLFGEWWRIHTVLPARTPVMLILVLFFWAFVWGFSIWRRAQFGRFTRGERELWAKALAAFWVVEFVTIGSILIVYCWMNWGPLPLVPRRLFLPRRGLLFEFFIYTYIIFLGYVAKFSVNWCSWRIQLALGMAVLFIFYFLLWRDLSCLLFRDTLDKVYGVRWRNVRLTAVVYSLTHEWWVSHVLGRRDSLSYFLGLPEAYVRKNHPLKVLPVMTEFEARHWLPESKSSKRRWRGVWNLVRLKKCSIYYANFDLLNRGYYYPRRLGFIPKRWCMWQLLTFLKMFHHMIILLWWILFIYRKMSRRQTSYNFLSSCHFNVYCCFLMTLMIYFIYYALYWEMILKLRPGVFTPHRFSLFTSKCWGQMWDCYFHGKRQRRFKELCRVTWWRVGAIFF